MTVIDVDPARREAFAGRMLDIFDDACLAFLTSVGHQTGLFDTMAGMPAATSEEIARSCGLTERYVREWLGGMVVGGIVEYFPETATYRLPPEHAASLTRAAGPENLAGLTQYLALMGEVEQQVVNAFRQGGGVPYSAYPRFQALQAEESGRIWDAALVRGVLPMVPGLTERLTAGIDVLDVGTGQGHVVNVLARAFPKSRVKGVDISAQGIAAARREAEQLGLENAEFAVVDAAEPLGSHDLITAFDVIHDLARPTRTLAAISDALREDGVFLMGEVNASSRLEENLDHPLGPGLYTFSVFYCMTVSLGEGGEGLGTVWGRQAARAALTSVGFTDIESHSLEGDFLNVYYAARKG
ncbi:class I SAM-dependent methyltransferase [Embleya sp. NPDC050154]|uniref:class I SAM-dependent methyltransferase n=1 Tax=Embleya sp. NPDC050154 TaxID=3363988 RepID=UPI0037981481